MILKKNKYIVLTFLLALFEYLCHDGKYKLKNITDRAKFQHNDLSLILSHLYIKKLPFVNALFGNDMSSGGSDSCRDNPALGRCHFPEKGSCSRYVNGGVKNKNSLFRNNYSVLFSQNIRGHFRILNEQTEGRFGGATKTDLQNEHVQKDAYGQPLLQAQPEVISPGVGEKTLPERESPLITEKTRKRYLDICKKIRSNQFSYDNCEIFHKKPEVTLYKNLLDDKSETRYDLIGYGTLNDVSLYGMSYALNNVDTIKKWNKNIYILNYLNITKPSILEKYNINEKINASKLILPNESEAPKGNRKYMYLVNGLPWPFKSHDTIYEVYQNYNEEENMLLIANKSVNDTFLNNSSYTRISNYENFFCIYPKSKNSYEKGLDYVISLYYDVNIPKFLQNNILNQIFPSLVYSLYDSSKAMTEKGMNFTEEEIKKNPLPFELKEGEVINELNAAQANSKSAQLDKASSGGASILRIIFIDPFTFVWTANVSLFKKIYVFITSMF
ncbi:StAR-related lipid transfer protein, putative [Plasmodium malariae]|uniref:StAR-related lipid transfer protein, putative n=1 Tax=Plasmodium malariae TaxID=5858 RepID=A0A1A8X1Y2_PLAMA|nr:StAR-related lipid transfer protein, putative [Plasmodium malariae]